MKKLSSILIFLGLALIIFVAYTKIQTYMEQKKLVEELNALTFPKETEQQAKAAKSKPKDGEAIGILKISKIDLKTPVVEGATQDDIRYAVGHLPSSGSVDDLGKDNQNFAIAGHRSYTYGQFFNRLDELKKGNKIILNTKERKFTYKVFKKKIIKPTDVEVVKPIKGKSIITLITCHPKNSNKQRLVIFAELAAD